MSARRLHGSILTQRDGEGENRNIPGEEKDGIGHGEKVLHAPRPRRLVILRRVQGKGLVARHHAGVVLSREELDERQPHRPQPLQSAPPLYRSDETLTTWSRFARRLTFRLPNFKWREIHCQEI
jgi:hypothetical protein